MKPIRWTAHALKEAKRRNIDSAEASRTILNPEQVALGNPPRQIYMRRYFDELLLTEMLLRVIIEETEEELVVVTLYKTSKLAKYLQEENP